MLFNSLDLHSSTPEYAEELVNIQVKLARWKLTFDNIWSNDKERRKVAEQSSALSQRVLNMSGLLSESLA